MQASVEFAGVSNRPNGDQTSREELRQEHKSHERERTREPMQGLQKKIYNMIQRYAVQFLAVKSVHYEQRLRPESDNAAVGQRPRGANAFPLHYKGGMPSYPPPAPQMFNLRFSEDTTKTRY